MSAVPPKSYGAAAVGCTAQFDVEIDEALDDPNDLQMGINTRQWSFRFCLSARSDVARMLSFLREHTGRVEFAELVVGSFHGARVVLVKDNEFADRFWLRALGACQLAEFVLAAEAVTEFTEAIAQVVQDLQRRA
jgi:hypothetical protein